MKVLIAIDEKSFARPIANFVTRHKWAPATDFKVINVVEPLLVGSYMSLFPAPMLNTVREEMLGTGRDLVRRVALSLRDAFHTTRVEEEVVEGNPKDAIIRCAKDWGADLIILGSHGREGMGRVLLGSVSLSVSATAPCSVLVVRPAPARNGQGSSENRQDEQRAVKELVP